MNLAAPHPLPNYEFLSALRQAWGTRIGLPTASWMLEIGIFLLRTESELILKSRGVVPGRLRIAGFEFQYPGWHKASCDLVTRWRARQEEMHSSRAVADEFTGVALLSDG